MYGEKRARQIEYKARKQRESLAGVSNTAPLNVQVRLRAYCMIWELKQKYYKADTPLPYVSKATLAIGCRALGRLYINIVGWLKEYFYNSLPTDKIRAMA